MITPDPHATVDAGPPRKSEPTGSVAPPSVPGYEILRELGRGGMGVVYLARHVELDRTVALKMILAGGLAGPADRARFRTEAAAVARLSHPGIVRVYETGEADGHPWFALEFCPAGSLADRLKGGPMPAASAAVLIRDLAHAVQHAHAGNIVHRDLKPANILFAEDGTPKVTDFGLAKRADADEALTGTGTTMGTPAYMAPEQWTDARRAGPAADVWALGVVLYECLTGNRPFPADTSHGIMARVLNDEPTRTDGIPTDLDTIVRRCLEKEPARRFASAEALAEELRRWLDGEPLTIRPVSGTERAIKWVRRNPVVAVSLALVVLAMVTATAISTVFYRAAVDRAERERRAKEEAVRLEHLAEAETDRAEGLLYASRLALAKSEWERGDVAAATSALVHARAERRGWEWHYLSTLLRLDQAILAHRLGKPSAVAFSPDGRRIACAGPSVSMWDAVTGDAVAQPSRPGSPPPFGEDQATCLAWSPNGLWLVAGHTDGIARILEADDVRKLVGHRGPVTAVAVSPDGRLVLTGSADGTARLWDAATGKEVRIVELPGKSAVSGVAFSADGSRFATASADNLARLWDTDTGRERFVLVGHSGSVTGVAFSPDGVSVATASDDWTAAVWDAATGKERFHIEADGPVAAVAWTPDGRQFVTASADGLLSVWDAANGRPRGELKGHAGAVSAVAVSPEGRRFASTGEDGTLRLWDAVRGQSTAVVSDPTGVACLAWSADGRRVLVGGGRTRVIDAAHRRELVALPADGSEIVAASWSPDGSRFVTAGERLVLRNADTGRELLSLAGQTVAVTFSPDGKFVAGSTDGAVRVWDASDGREVWSRPVSDALGLAWSPDGSRLAVGCSDRAVRLFAGPTGGDEVALTGHGDAVTCVAFSPDGTRLASGSADRTIRLWEMPSGRWQRTLINHAARVRSVAWSPDGSRIVSAAGEPGGRGEVRLWTGSDESALLALPGHSAPANAAAFSPDGRRLATASADGIVRLWDAAIGRTPEESGREVLARIAVPDADWHLTRAVSAERGGVWFAAAFHTEKAADAMPFDIDMRLRAAELWAKAGHPARAALQVALAARAP